MDAEPERQVAFGWEARRFARYWQHWERRAAPHPPAGTFSPYSDGEKGMASTLAPHSATATIGETIGDGVFLPVTIRGEMPGRAMRGSADRRNIIRAPGVRRF
ncbi:MAG: hypothetical protein E5X48_14785 [Mesorhizobium sp.]|nr:MAG: hypothetical protein E5X48_14785 [Mesorhizobium sp.]